MSKYSYKIVLRSDRKRADGAMPLILQAFIGGNRVRISMNISLRPEEFDPVRMMAKIKGDAQRSQRVNALIAKFKSQAEDIIFESMLNGVTLTPSKFEEYFDRKPALGDFILWMRQQIADLDGTVAPVTIKHYHATAKWLTKYKPVILFADIDYEFVSGFDTFLRKQKLDGNTCVSHHRKLRKFILLAKKKGKRLQNPYEDFKFREIPKERTYLNAQEVAKLRALYDRKELKPRLQSTLRHFLFQVGTSLRYSDLVAITTDNIEGSLLIFQPEKTKRVGKVVKVPLSTMAKDMLRDSESTDNKLFPVHAEQVMNRFLKEISDYVGFSKKLTTHVGRHTFGYLFIAAGGQVEVLQKIMGHSDIKTTMIYTHIDTRQIRAGVAQLDTFLSTMAD